MEEIPPAASAATWANEFSLPVLRGSNDDEDTREVDWSPCPVCGSVRENLCACNNPRCPDYNGPTDMMDANPLANFYNGN